MRNFCSITVPSKKAEMFLQKFTSQVSLKNLRLDLAEWFETASREDVTSPCFITTVVQRPGAMGLQVLPQEYKSLSSARMDGSKLLAEILADYGVQSISTDIRDDRFVVTGTNGVRVTMVID